VLPKIRIKNARLLRHAASEPMNQVYGDGTPLLSHEEYQAIVARYQAAWEPYEEKILRGMEELLGLEFYQNTIDVYIAPWFRAFSDPLVMGVKFSDSDFVSTLAHELLHRLLTDNTSTRRDDPELIADWEKMIGEGCGAKTLVHIPVHAMLKALYLDILNEPERLQDDIAKCQKNLPYKEAWEYVEAGDYRDIIRHLRSYYASEA